MIPTKPVSLDQALNFFLDTSDTTLCLERRCRLFAAARIALTSKPCLAASSSRTRRTSSTIGSLGMSYSPDSSSGVQITGHSHPCSRQGVLLLAVVRRRAARAMLLDDSRQGSQCLVRLS